MLRLAGILAAGVAMALVLGCGGKEKTPEVTIEDIAIKYGGRPEVLADWARKAKVAGIKPYLTSQNNPNRITAINALGCLKGNPEATQLLIGIADGPNPQDALFATMALGRQGAPEAKAVIERFFQSPDPALRKAACMAIGVYGDRALYPLLDKAATDDDPAVRMAAGVARNLRDFEKIRQDLEKK